ncbi:MAG: hypothetical protein ACRBFS_11350 [Aureispira sp.]
MKLILLFLLLCFLVACKTSAIVTTKNTFSICIDSLDAIPPMATYNPLYFGRKYKPLYIGQEQDPLFIDYYCRLRLGFESVVPPPPPYPPAPNIPDPDTLRAVDLAWQKKVAYWQQQQAPYKGYVRYDRDGEHLFPFIPYSNAKVEIFVDTNHLLLTEQYIPDAATFPPLAQGYPVLIKNKGTDTLSFGYQGYLRLTVEEQQANGSWAAFEEGFHRIESSRYMLLPPNEMVVTVVPVYQWKKKRIFRVKYGSNYSNSFKGRVVQE